MVQEASACRPGSKEGVGPARDTPLSGSWSLLSRELLTRESLPVGGTGELGVEGRGVAMPGADAG